MAGFYKGYVIGKWETYWAWDPDLYVPLTISGTQLCRIVGKYLDDNPDKHHLVGDWLVRQSITEAFGVKK